MKNMIRGIILFSALAGAVRVNAQAPQSPQTAENTPTADETVEKYIGAIGGKEAISKVKSISTEGSSQMMGTNVTTTAVILDGVGYKSEMSFNGNKILSCYTAKGGWSINPMAGASDPVPMPDNQYKMGKGQIFVGVFIGGALYEYAAMGSRIELLGKDANTYKIKLTSKDNVESIFVIDAATWLVKSVKQKAKTQDQDVDITTTYSDYRKTEAGFLLPYFIGMDFGGQYQLTTVVEKLELNKTIDPAVFEMPKYKRN